MIVLGSRAHRAASLAIRSVVGKVLGHGLCPVVVIPVGAEELKSDFPAQAA